MKCEQCHYNRITDNGVIKQTCSIANMCNLKGCSLPSDKVVPELEICFNCQSWIGGGDWGLSCKEDYYNCNSNGFTKACEKFRGKEGYNDSN